MADWTWSNGELTRVLYRVGTHSDGRDRFRRAPFDFLEWDITGSREHYILTPPAEAGTARDIETITASPQDWSAGVEFGFYGLDERIALASGDTDTQWWNGLHSFGYF